MEEWIKFYTLNGNLFSVRCGTLFIYADDSYFFRVMNTNAPQMLNGGGGKVTAITVLPCIFHLSSEKHIFAEKTTVIDRNGNACEVNAL